jgi:hypothetical protein
VRIPADPLQAIEIQEPFLRETFRPLTNVENVENKKSRAMTCPASDD